LVNGVDHAAAIDGSNAAAAATIPTGLTGAQALRRRAEFGPNTVSERTPSRWRDFLSKFWGPIPWMLEAAIVLQVGLDQHIEAAVIGGLLLFNATLGFFQEGRAGAALAALAVMASGLGCRHPNLYRATRSGCRSAPWCPPMRLSRQDR
jgi:magnesium-transporting ATPase (P-type)